MSLVEFGPLAWIVGALGGIVVAGAGYWLGRDRLTAQVKCITLPARLVRMILRRGELDTMIAEGRSKCRDSVRQLMDKELEPLAPEIATQVWMRVKPAVGASEELRAIHEHR